MMFVSNFVVGFTIAALVITGCAASCSDASVRSCQRSSLIDAYLERHNIDVNSEKDVMNSLKLTLSTEEMRQYCRLYDVYSACLKRSVIPYCDSKTTSLLRGLEDGMNYFCHQTFDEFTQKYRGCLATASARDGIKTCSKASISSMRADVSVDAICRDLVDGENCEVKAVRERCGIPAATWISTLIRKYSHYTKAEVNCPRHLPVDLGGGLPTEDRSGDYYSDSDSDESSGMHVAYTVVLCVIGGVLGVFLCVARVVCSYRRHRTLNPVTRAVIIAPQGGHRASSPNQRDSHLVVVPDNKLLMA